VHDGHTYMLPHVGSIGCMTVTLIRRVFR